jgi:cytosine/creatinine deaminase
VSAIRTHLDSYEGQAETTWAVFRDVRDAWKSRITLQGVALVALDELVCRPQHDRIVVRNGRALGREVLDYAELEAG